MTRLSKILPRPVHGAMNQGLSTLRKMPGRVLEDLRSLFTHPVFMTAATVTVISVVVAASDAPTAPRTDLLESWKMFLGGTSNNRLMAGWKCLLALTAAAGTVFLITPPSQESPRTSRFPKLSHPGWALLLAGLFFLATRSPAPLVTTGAIFAGAVAGAASSLLFRPRHLGGPLDRIGTGTFTLLVAASFALFWFALRVHPRYYAPTSLAMFDWHWGAYLRDSLRLAHGESPETLRGAYGALVHAFFGAWQRAGGLWDLPDYLGALRTGNVVFHAATIGWCAWCYSQARHPLFAWLVPLCTMVFLPSGHSLHYPNACLLRYSGCLLFLFTLPIFAREAKPTAPAQQSELRMAWPKILHGILGGAAVLISSEFGIVIIGCGLIFWLSQTRCPWAMLRSAAGFGMGAGAAIAAFQVTSWMTFGAPWPWKTILGFTRSHTGAGFGGLPPTLDLTVLLLTVISVSAVLAAARNWRKAPLRPWHAASLASFIGFLGTLPYYLSRAHHSKLAVVAMFGAAGLAYAILAASRAGERPTNPRPNWAIGALTGLVICSGFWQLGWYQFTLFRTHSPAVASAYDSLDGIPMEQTRLKGVAEKASALRTRSKAPEPFAWVSPTTFTYILLADQINGTFPPAAVLDYVFDPKLKTDQATAVAALVQAGVKEVWFEGEPALPSSHEQNFWQQRREEIQEDLSRVGFASAKMQSGWDVWLRK